MFHSTTTKNGIQFFNVFIVYYTLCEYTPIEYLLSYLFWTTHEPKKKNKISSIFIASNDKEIMMKRFSPGECRVSYSDTRYVNSLYYALQR